MTIYPRVYAWSLYDISRVVLTQQTTFNVVLNYVTWGELHYIPYDGGLLARHDVTLAMAQSHAQRWFYALMSWEFFLGKRTFHLVVPTFKVPRDPPLEISCFEVIVDDPIYATGSFKGFLIEDTNYVA